MTQSEQLMAGKRGLVIGVANDHSIAWGIAAMLARHGAELAFTYQDEKIAKRVRPLADSVGAEIVMPADVEDSAALDAVFARLSDEWGRLDFLVHSLAYSDRSELGGRYLDTSGDNFVRTLLISCYSLTDLCRRAEPLMHGGGSIVTLSYAGSERVMPNYNVMGVAKAALEASVRYLAVDLGSQGIRVNAISAGPMRTLAGSVISGARYVYNFTRTHAPLKRNVHLDEVGGAGLYLLSDLSGAVTGEVHHVDCGYHAVGMPAQSSQGGPAGEPGKPGD